MTDETNKVRQVEADGYDPMLRSALGDFRASVHAWSDAAYNRSQPVAISAPERVVWRRAAAWALSLTLSFGILGTAVYERHRSQLIAQEKQHQQERERQRLADEQQRALQTATAKDAEASKDTAGVGDTEDLMATVDRDVSRQVPTAMAPLALTADEIQ
jgi:hypothetical protein